MNRLRAIFSRKHLPKILLLIAVYLLGRMDGEGRFRWADVCSTIWDGTLSIAASAASSAKGVVGR